MRMKRGRIARLIALLLSALTLMLAAAGALADGVIEVDA